MSKAKAVVSAVGGSVEDAAANFYEALQTADLERLMACWADEDDVFCVHPGGLRLVGLGAIRAAYEAMFSVGSLRIQPEAVRKIDSMASSVHSVRERIVILTDEGPIAAYVLATNVFLKTAQGWRLVAHHASPGAAHEVQDISELPPVLH